MKNLFYTSLMMIFAISIFSSCGGGGDSDSIVGTWQLESVSGEELTDSEKQTLMTFNEDGTAVRQRGERKKEAKWEMFEKDGKKYYKIIHGNDAEEFEIVSLDAKKFVFKDGNDVITLKKK